jgi:hypothetical protein
MLDAVDCIMVRYYRLSYREACDDPCQCVCHQPPDDGLDDDEREAIRAMGVRR